MADGSCQADGPGSPAAEEKLQAAAASPPPPGQQQEDNEFILDGFDFSTGLSICQALDLDEDEAGSSTVKRSSLLLPNKEVTDPSELGNVLLKALGVNKGASGSAESTAARPHSTNTGEFGDLCATLVATLSNWSMS